MPHPDAHLIDDAVDLWHDGAGEGLELHEFLGMQWDDYVSWATSGFFSPQWRLPEALLAQLVRAPDS